MSLNVTFRQLQKHLPDIIDRAVNEDEVASLTAAVRHTPSS